jgi:hypothetical protein
MQGHYLKGLCYHGLGRHRDAFKSFSTGLLYNPIDPGCRCDAQSCCPKSAYFWYTLVKGASAIMAMRGTEVGHPPVTCRHYAALCLHALGNFR